MAGLIILGVVAVLVLIVLFSSFFTVEQQTAAVVERFGKFQRVARSGLNFKVPIIDRVAGRINLRVQQLDVNVETKTLDELFGKTISSSSGSSSSMTLPSHDPFGTLKPVIL